MTGASSVPRVFVDGNFIGGELPLEFRVQWILGRCSLTCFVVFYAGGDETTEMAGNGKLRELLVSKGVIT